MAETVTVPKVSEGEDWYAKSPGWASVQDGNGNKLKPIIRCNCGKWSGIGLHHVHIDGTITNSFFHATKAQHSMGTDDGCGWHVMLKLKDYDDGDFPPRS